VSNYNTGNNWKSVTYMVLANNKNMLLKKENAIKIYYINNSIIFTN